MTTSTLTRLADQAVAARNGADLYRFGLADRIPDASFAKNPDGSFTIAGVDFLKAGTFNGLQLLETDLESMVERYRTLADGGIFLPPFRLDHSWSILSVIGYVENLETYRRVDSTDSLEKTFLRGDVRVTGSVDYEPAALVAAIKRGALRTRSSELGYYVTNSGLELPLVFYGCAFVDIPAVEGLAPVELSRTRLSTPHKITTLTLDDPEGSTMTTPADTTPDETPEGTAGDVEEAPAGDDAVEETGGEPTPDVELEEAPADDVEESVETDEDAELEEAAADDAELVDEPGDEETDEPTGDVEVETPPAGEQLRRDDDELARLRAENARLRQEATDREIARLRSAGVIVQANEDDAIALLSHDDEEVRRRTGTLLANLPSTVVLDRRRGKVTLSSNDGANAGGTGAKLIRLGMPKDEVSDLWASLSTEERAKYRDEYEAWRLDRQENGVRD